MKIRARTKKFRSLPCVALCAVSLAALSLQACSNKNGADKPDKPSVAAQAQVAQTTQASPQSGDPVLGKAVYDKHCHYCHGKTGHGDGPVGMALTPHPVDFVNDAKRMSKSDKELFKSISEGIRRDIGGESMSMPRWAEVLTVKERWAVLAYIRQLHGSPEKK